MELQKLWLSYLETRSPDLENIICQNYLPRIKAFIRTTFLNSLRIDEVESEISLVLLTTVRNFDLNKVKPKYHDNIDNIFFIYLCFIAKFRIINFLNNGKYTMFVRRKNCTLPAFEKNFYNENGFMPSDAEKAAFLKLTNDQYIKRYLINKKPNIEEVPLEKFVDKQSNQLEYDVEELISSLPKVHRVIIEKKLAGYTDEQIRQDCILSYAEFKEKLEQIRSFLDKQVYDRVS